MTSNAEHKERLSGFIHGPIPYKPPVYCEYFDDFDQAIAREKEIKRLTRRQKVKLIESSNPESSPSGTRIPPRGSHACGNDRGAYPCAIYAM